MEQSTSWEINRSSASQEISRILWIPKVHYRTHKSLSPVPVQSQINLVHAPNPVLEYFNIILPSMPGYSKCSLSLRFPHQNPVSTCHLPYTCYMPSPSHSCWLEYPNNIRWRVLICKLLVVAFSTTLLAAPIRPEHSPQHPIRQHPQPTFLPQRGNVSDQVSHPYRTTGKITALKVLIFKFLDSRLEDKRFCTEW